VIKVLVLYDEEPDTIQYAAHAEVCRQVPGGTFRHGKVIGRIVPVAVGELDDWIAGGRVVPATVAGPVPMPVQRAPEGEDAGRLLRELRDEERW